MKKIILSLLLFQSIFASAQIKVQFNAGILKVVNNMTLTGKRIYYSNFGDRVGYTAGVSLEKDFSHFSLLLNSKYLLKGGIDEVSRDIYANMHYIQVNPEIGGIHPLKFVDEPLLNNLDIGCGIFANFLVKSFFANSPEFKEKFEYGYSIFVRYSYKKLGLKLFFQEALTPYIEADFGKNSHLEVINRMSGLSLFYTLPIHKSDKH